MQSRMQSERMERQFAQLRATPFGSPNSQEPRSGRLRASRIASFVFLQHFDATQKLSIPASVPVRILVEGELRQHPMKMAATIRGKENNLY
jgi:hypothetical protein